MRLESQSVIKDIQEKVVLSIPSIKHIEEATKVAQRMLGKSKLDITHLYKHPRKFSVGEYCPKFSLKPGETLEGKTVYQFMPSGPDKDPESLILRSLMDAFDAKEHYADKVVQIETDFTHGRQDKGWQEDKKSLGEPTTVRFKARAYKAMGIDEIISLHAHSNRIPAYFAIEYGLIPDELLPEEARGLPPEKIKVPEHVNPDDPIIQRLGKKVFKSISPHAILADYLLNRSSLKEEGFLENNGAKLFLKQVDKGNEEFINNLAESMFLEHLGILRCGKLREEKNNPDKVNVEVIGASENILEAKTIIGRREILADDGLDTGGTMIKAVKWSERGNICSETGIGYGVPDGRLIYFTHSWLGGVSYNDVQSRLVKDITNVKEFLTTNTRPFISNGQYYRFKTMSTVLRLAGLWADVILTNEIGSDVSKRYVNFDSVKEQHDLLNPLYALKRHSAHFMGNNEESRIERVDYMIRE